MPTHETDLKKNILSTHINTNKIIDGVEFSGRLRVYCCELKFEFQLKTIYILCLIRLKYDYFQYDKRMRKKKKELIIFFLERL